MPTRSVIRYLHYDVFTDETFAGNQLAVVPAAEGIDPQLMQRIANEMNFSETTFVLPAEDDESDVRMRIFTPCEELPMAGHPTVGSTFALAHEGRIPPGSERFVFGLGIGPTPVELEWDGERLTFAWMRQPVPRFLATVDDRTALAAGLGITGEDLGPPGLPAQIASAGVEFLLVPLASREAVDAVVYDRGRMSALFESAALPERGVMVFHPEPDGPDGPRRLQPDVRTRPRRPGGSRHRQRHRTARWLPRVSLNRGSGTGPRHDQHPGRRDGSAQPDLHRGRGRLRRDLRRPRGRNLRSRGRRDGVPVTRAHPPESTRGTSNNLLPVWLRKNCKFLHTRTLPYSPPLTREQKVRLRETESHLKFPADGEPICSRTMKVHQLFAFVAIMMVGLALPAFSADKEKEVALTKYKSTWTGIT